MTTVMVLARNETQSNDGKTSYYNLAILTDEGQAGNLSCTKDVYELVEPMKVQTFVAEYNDVYKSLRLLKLDMQTPVCDADGVIASTASTASTAPDGKQNKK